MTEQEQKENPWIRISVSNFTTFPIKDRDALQEKLKTSSNRHTHEFKIRVKHRANKTFDLVAWEREKSEAELSKAAKKNKKKKDK